MRRIMIILVLFLLYVGVADAATRNYTRTGGSAGALNTDQLAALLDSALGVSGTAVRANVVPTQVFVTHPTLTAANDAAVQAVLTAYTFDARYQTPEDIATTRTTASTQITSSTNADAKLARALVAVLLDELNLHALKTNEILDAVDAATSLADLKTRIAAIPHYPQRTPAQIKTAIQNKLASGAVD